MISAMKTGSANYQGQLLWLERLSRWLLAGVMLAAGVPKLFSPVSFAEVIEAYGLIPDFLVLAAAITLPIAELIAAFLLIMGKKSGLWLTALLMILFIAVLTYGIWLGLDIDCGCFGPEAPEHEAFSGLRTAWIRDVLLCFPLVYCICYAYKFPFNLSGERQ